MARQLRIELPGAWYHVTARGNARRAIFRGDGDRRHFLDLLEESVHRHHLKLHAYGLMDNHYHLIMETPQANLSAAMQWLGVSYSTWFNRRHRRVGHLFQGRFKGVLAESSRALSLSQYLHLNPVRVKRFGLDRATRQRGRAGAGRRPDQEWVRARLDYLHRYRWSSYGAYVGAVVSPKWLTVNVVLRMIGGKTVVGRQKAYREYVENEIREGFMSHPWEGLVEQVLLGGEAFIEKMKGLIKGNGREQREIGALKRRASWDEIVAALEKVKGENWGAFCDRHGDWGRDLALYVGRRECGMKLRELGASVGGMDYGSVAMALHRLAKRLREEPALTRVYGRVTKLIVKK